MAQWLSGTVITTTHWTETLFSLRVKTEPFDFIAGQFVRLALDTADGKVQRAYSLLNSPGDTEQEFLISTVEDGLLTPLLQQLKPGDIVDISQPASGFFILDEVPDGKNLWLMATGTGIGPYLSMLGTDIPWQRFSAIVLLHSVRYAAELVYQPLISQWRQRYGAQLHYQPIVTREAKADALQQRIPELIQTGALQQACGQSLDQESQVLLCGNPQMINETRAVLERLGLRKNLRRDPGQITVEQYWK